MGKSYFWWLGDWLVYGQEMFNVTPEQRALDKRNLKRVESGVIKQASEVLGLSPGYLWNVKACCLRVLPSCRRENISGHHAIEILAQVPDAQLTYWMDRAVNEKLSVRELRATLRAHNRTSTPSPQTTRPSLFAQRAMVFVADFKKESADWTPAQWNSYRALLDPLIKSFESQTVT